MKEKIAEIISMANEDGKKSLKHPVPYVLADQILSLPTDVMVEEKCPVCKGIGSWPDTGFSRRPCVACKGGTISRHLTVGEIQNKAKEWVEVLQTVRNVLVVACGETAPYIKIALQKIDNALALNSGKIEEENSVKI